MMKLVTKMFAFEHIKAMIPPALPGSTFTAFNNLKAAFSLSQERLEESTAVVLFFFAALSIVHGLD